MLVARNKHQVARNLMRWCKRSISLTSVPSIRRTGTYTIVDLFISTL